MNITNPLRIGTAIREVLLDNELIAERIGGSIFAYTTKDKVGMPNIVYDGISVDYEEYKDGALPSEVSISLNVNTIDHPSGIALAEEVLDVLTEHGCVPVAVSCEYDNAALMFTHNLTFKVQI